MEQNIWLGIISIALAIVGVWKIRESSNVKSLTERVKTLESEQAISKIEIATRDRQIAQLLTQNRLIRDERSALTRLLRHYEEAGRESLIVTDKLGKVVEWDAAATLMFGWSADEAIGEDVSELIVPQELRQAHREALRNVYRNQRQPRTVPIKAVALTKTNERVSVEVQLLPGWETGSDSGEWRYGARIKKLLLPSQTNSTAEMPNLDTLEKERDKPKG